MDNIPPDSQAAEHWITSELSSPVRLGNFPTFSNRDFFPLHLCLHQNPLFQGMSHQAAGSPGRSEGSAQAVSVSFHLTKPNGQSSYQNKLLFPREMSLQHPSGGCLLLTQQVSRM